MIYVYAQYNSRTGTASSRTSLSTFSAFSSPRASTNFFRNVYSKDFTQPPVIEHFGEVRYRGNVFEVWEKGETYAAARDKAMARLAVYFAKRSELYAKRATTFANSSLRCSGCIKDAHGWEGGK